MTVGCKEYIGSSQFIGISLVLQLCRLPQTSSRLGTGWNLVSWFSGESLKSLPPNVRF